MLLLCSVDTFFRVEKEFSHTAAEAPKVRAIWNGASPPSSVLSVHIQASGGVEQSTCVRKSWQVTLNSVSTAAVFFCPKRHAIIPESALSQLYLLALWSSGFPVFLIFAQWQTSKCQLTMHFLLPQRQSGASTCSVHSSKNTLLVRGASTHSESVVNSCLKVHFLWS